MYNYSVIFCLVLCICSQVKGQITCPSCSNGYDPTSCTLTQNCHAHDVCELHVHLADHNRVEYICHKSHDCTNQATHPCSPTHHEVCTFCCDSLQSCQQEREHLFTDRFTSVTHTTSTTTQPTTEVTTHSTTDDTTHTSTEAPTHTTDTATTTDVVTATTTTAAPPKGQITCPSCSNGYDPTSCTLTQHCHDHDACELHVHSADHNRVEYICRKSHDCTNQATHPCSPTHHEVCTFCCDSLQSCQQEREHLFTDRFTSVTHRTSTTTQPPTTTTQPSTTTTQPPTTTTQPPTTTTQPPTTTTQPPTTTTQPSTEVTTQSTTDDTTHTSTEAPTLTSTVAPTLTSTEAPTHTTDNTTTTDAVTATTTTTSSSNSSYRCVKCDTDPCDEAKIANLTAVQCPTSQPYCYTETVQTNSTTSVSKGCADQSFCRRKWWDYSAVLTLCQEPYFSTTMFDFECTFCCEGDDCNRDERPADNTLMSF